LSTTSATVPPSSASLASTFRSWTCTTSITSVSSQTRSHPGGDVVYGRWRREWCRNRSAHLCSHPGICRWRSMLWRPGFRRFRHDRNVSAQVRETAGARQCA
jgi:hypothetical protein